MLDIEARIADAGRDIEPDGAAAASAIDPADLRKVLGTFVTGVTVITTIDASGKAYGLTANSFTSVSLNPPIVLWNLSLTAPSHPIFREASRFAVNILADDQIDISKRFASLGRDKFAGVAVRRGLGGIPLIEGCAAYLECRSEASFPGGDHIVFLGSTPHGLRQKLPEMGLVRTVRNRTRDGCYQQRSQIGAIARLVNTDNPCHALELPTGLLLNTNTSWYLMTAR